MAVDFSKFDQKVDLQELQKEVHDAPESNLQTYRMVIMKYH